MSRAFDRILLWSGILVAFAALVLYGAVQTSVENIRSITHPEDILGPFDLAKQLELWFIPIPILIGNAVGMIITVSMHDDFSPTQKVLFWFFIGLQSLVASLFIFTKNEGKTKD